MKILVRGTNWIGDAVMQIPALRQLRRVFPDASLTLHTRAWAQGIFEDADFVDEILTFETSKSKFRDVFTQAKILRQRKFDLVVLFPNSFESALTAKLANIKTRIGYDKDARSFLLTDVLPIPEWKNRKHEVFYYLNLVAEVEKKFVGTETVLLNGPQFDLRFRRKGRRRREKFWRRAELICQKK